MESRGKASICPCLSKYRGLVARGNYLAQDRTDIANTVKDLSKDMANPTEESWAKLKRFGRYLLGALRYVLEYKYQEAQDHIEVWTDTDFAGCVKSRKSTSAGVTRLGTHVIKSWSTNQSVVAQSSGEAEYYGLVKGASMAIGSRSVAKDLGMEYSESVRVKSDASAAIGIATRIGIGKVRHIEVSQLWLQHQVYRGDIVIIKVKR